MIPPPEPASVPQVNTPFCHRSLSAGFAQEVRPAPVKLLEMFRFVVVALVVVELPVIIRFDGKT